MALTASLHTHSNFSINDGYPSVKELVEASKAKGARAIAMTDHGNTVGLLEYIEECKKNDIKFIPGVESYVYNPEILDSRRHIIMLAKSYKGWHDGISRIVSETANNTSKDGYPLTSEDMLNRWIGPNGPAHLEVIGTSACCWGIVNSIINQNMQFEKEEKKLLKKQGERPDIEKYEAVLAAIEKADKESKELKIVRDRNKLKSGDKDLYDEACKKLDELKSEVKALKLERDELKAPVERWQRYSQQLAEVKKQYVSDRAARKQAKEELIKYSNMFGPGCFFVEVQYHGLESEKRCMPIIVSLAKELGLPIVGANDAHLISPEQAEGRRALFANKYFWKEIEPSDRELYLKTDEELADALKQILKPGVVKEAISNIGTIVDMCNVEFPPYESHFPSFPCEEGGKLRLRALIKKGKKKIPNWNDTYQKRLEYELGVIEQLNFSDYMCIINDLVEYGNLLGKIENLEDEEFLAHKFDLEWLRKAGQGKVGVGCGLGRGSCAGSLIAYLINLTAVDPVANDLYFERFLNPSRVSWPDVDSDLCPEIRFFVIEYIKYRYGSERVAQIATFGYFMAKSSIAASARVLGRRDDDEKLYVPLAQEISKSIEDPNEKLENIKDQILEKYGDDEKAKELLETASLFSGKLSSFGTHAAGVIISNTKRIDDVVPLIKVGDQIDTACDPHDIESKLGLLKLDALGLRTLSIINTCIREIYKTTGTTIEPYEIPLDDKKVYEDIFCAGKTNGVFQFESSGMKRVLQQLKPGNIEDISMINALYRPGPLNSVDSIAAVKSGESKAEYCVPELKSILDVTYGSPIYQEQVMKIFSDVIGLSLAEADCVRRYMSKKKVDKFMEYHQVFVDGLMAKGASEEDAEAFWNSLISFSQYAFNKAHARCYAQLGYITAWLKLHYPAAFYTGLLNYTENDKREAVLHDAVSDGVQIVSPDINTASEKFTLNSDMQIVFSLANVNNVAGSASGIVRERNENGLFESFEDFLKRVSPRKNVLENLIKAGAFDCFCKSREALLIAAEDKMQAIADYKKNSQKLEEGVTERIRIKTEQKLEELEEVINKPIKSIDGNRVKALMEEREVLGSFISDHPVPKNTGCKTLKDAAEGERTTVVVFVSDFESKISKNGNTYGIIRLEDRTGGIEARVFASTITGNEDYLKVGKIIKVHLIRKEDGSYIVDKIEPFRGKTETIRRMATSEEYFLKKKNFVFNYPGDKHLVILCRDTHKYIHTEYYNVSSDLPSDIFESEKVKDI